MRFLKKHWRGIFACAVILTVGIAAYLRAPDIVPASFFSAPVLAGDDDDIFDIEAAPTNDAGNTIIDGAATICADGRALCTLADAGEANTLLTRLLDEAVAPAGETLKQVSFLQDITLRAAAEGESPIPAAEALALLRAETAACAVRMVTEKIERETIAFESEETEDARLPVGTRMLLQAGRNGQTLTATEHAYINAMPQDEGRVVETISIAPVAERVAVGTYTSAKPAKEPGRSEGEDGKEAPEGFSLQAPVKGDIISNFGMRKNAMHYGLDYDAKEGDDVLAPAAGTVRFIGERSSYGRIMEIDHGGGFVTRISPVQDCLLQAGSAVEQGQKIATLAAYPDDERDDHLHMELLIDGIPYNPRQYF